MYIVHIMNLKIDISIIKTVILNFFFKLELEFENFDLNNILEFKFKKTYWF